MIFFLLLLLARCIWDRKCPTSNCITLSGWKNSLNISNSSCDVICWNETYETHTHREREREKENCFDGELLYLSVRTKVGKLNWIICKEIVLSSFQVCTTPTSSLKTPITSTSSSSKIRCMWQKIHTYILSVCVCVCVVKVTKQRLWSHSFFLYSNKSTNRVTWLVSSKYQI